MAELTVAALVKSITNQRIVNDDTEAVNTLVNQSAKAIVSEDALRFAQAAGTLNTILKD